MTYKVQKTILQGNANLTLGINEGGNPMNDWYVSDESSLSDHIQFSFQISNIKSTKSLLWTTKESMGNLKKMT
jgi:hypothetical protein